MEGTALTGISKIDQQVAGTIGQESLSSHGLDQYDTILQN